MANVSIKENVYWIGVNDRTTDLFEGIWPISQEGVSYNSYRIKDKKKGIIDLSKAIKTDVFFDHIAEEVPLDEIDYVVVNHVEPDHTGVLRTLKRMAPRLTILCTPLTGCTSKDRTFTPPSMTMGRQMLQDVKPITPQQEVQTQ